MDFKKAPHSSDDRKVGFEFEFASVSVEDAAKIVQTALGGNIRQHNSAEATVKDTKLGDFTVEIDADIIKRVSNQLENKSDDQDSFLSKIKFITSQWIGDLSRELVPVEIVTPPIYFTSLNQLETLVEKLKSSDATGTEDAFHYAFGMHINPEIISKECDYLLNVLRAFLVLYPWLLEVMQVDPSRRILSYIDPFSRKYQQYILDPSYAPKLSRFCEDYVKMNPTRNRALDMLPLIAHMNKEWISPLPQNKRKLIKPRPTFHYRLPNCSINQKGWSVARDWNYWVEIETLADNRQKLKEISEEYVSFLGNPLHQFNHKEWSQKLEESYGFNAQSS